MSFPNYYKPLEQNCFSKDNYSIVPIRYEDRMDIMQWRNEQLYHLRQKKTLTPSEQDTYFQTVVSAIFEQNHPEQLLFSYLEQDKCIGYGGLVHINWEDRNAEISFIMDTRLEKKYFEKHWSVFLELLEKVAFEELSFHKIYTYAFDLRPHLYTALEKKGYEREATLKEHCIFEGAFKDVVIHAKRN